MPDSLVRPEDPLNALTDDDVRVAGALAGPLSGLTFVAKDLYDVAGWRTGAGSPAWLAAHGEADATAPALVSLLDAGADLVAKSHTDELAWSLLGQNAHFGTPTNPRNPERVPGGSSSGSVVAVAGGMVDFGVGSDTGGSVRVPTSNCGVYGIRTSHGTISVDGIVALAPSFDTVGWFARDAPTMLRVGHVLLGNGSADVSEQTALGGGAALRGGAVSAEDAFAVAGAGIEEALRPTCQRVAALLGGSKPGSLSTPGLERWASAWRTIQAREIWKAHGKWVEDTNPSFGPGIRERFEWARTVSTAEEREARAVQEQARAELDAAFAEGSVIIVPAAPSAAPLLDATADELERYRTRAMMLTCSAGLAELPQITVPAGEVEGCAVGLGIIGPAGSDLSLLELACRLSASG